ncbi:MAG TPA: PAS domain S-box protein, partial [Methanomicrobiales archaeon]|nr:PAS domain S-box protein [Methanomicrobiales archaeon]
LKLEGCEYIFAFVRDITERKRAEEAARASQQQLADIINFLPDATFVIDRDRRVIAWNQAVEQMTGVSAKEMLGQGSFAYSVPFYGKRRPILIDLIGQTNIDVEAEYQYVQRNGETLIAEVYVPSLFDGRGAFLWAKASPLYDREGNLVGAIETVRDVTDQKKAEEALRESEELFRTLVDSMLDATLILDWDGRVLFANRAAAQLVGLDSAQLATGRNVMDFLTPECREAVGFDLSQVRGDQGGFLANYQLTTCNGQMRWVEGLGTKIRFRGVTADLVSLRDITERRSAEGALRTSEEKFRAVFHNANDAILLNELTPEGMPGGFIEVNDLACARLGYSREELLASTPQDLGVMDCIQKNPNLLKDIRAGKAVTFEMTLVSRGGMLIPVEINSHTFTLGDRPVILSIARDITERRMNEEVEKKAFEQIEKNIDQLAILGDHIRNPLAVIMALADMDGMEGGKRIVEQCQIIDDLITRLDKGWIESDKVQDFIRRHYGTG